jgi:hypothetical protein
MARRARHGESRACGGGRALDASHPRASHRGGAAGTREASMALICGKCFAWGNISPLHRQRLYGAVSQTNRIAFSLLRKLNDSLGDDF